MMLETIIEWSIKNKFIVILLTCFVAVAGVYSLRNTPIDAIPDLSDVQVIIYTEYPGQAPQVVEDQVTYPLTTQMLSVPHAKVVRGPNPKFGKTLTPGKDPMRYREKPISKSWASVIPTPKFIVEIVPVAPKG